MNNSIRSRILTSLVSFVLTIVLIFIAGFALYLNYSLRQQLTNTLQVQANNAASNIEDRMQLIQNNLIRLSSSDVVINTIIDIQGRDEYIAKVFDNFNASNQVLATELYNYSGKLIYTSDSQSKMSVSASVLLVTLELGKEHIIFDPENLVITFVTPIQYYDTTQAALATYVNFTDLLQSRQGSESGLSVSYYIDNQLIHQNVHQSVESDKRITVYSTNHQDLKQSGILALSASVGMTRSDFFGPIYTALQVLFLIGLIILIVTLIMGNILAKKLAQPIVNLAKTISRPYEHTPPKCAPLGTNDELEILAEAFDARSQALLDASINLQQEVEQHKKTQTYLLDLQEQLEHLVEIRTRDLQQKTDELEAANKTKSLFLASMSHELRTPLNSIIGFTNIILKRKSADLNESVIDALTTVNRCGHTLHTLVNDILDLSKIEAGKMEAEYQWVNLNAILQDLEKRFCLPAEEKQLAFCLRCDIQPCNIFTDNKLFKQVMDNLVSNAIKYTERGGVTIITCQAEATSKQPGIRILVQDTGIGISADDQSRLFEDFSRVSDKVNNIEGTGLGLSIVSKLVEILGLDLTLESTVDQGSTFTIYIPVQKTDMKQDHVKASG
jgi:signal transduction histidine kinase